MNGEATPAPRATPTRWYPRLVRLPDRGVAGGVAAGVARHLGVGVTPVRIVFAVLASLSGAGLLAYAALWVMLPARDAPEDAPSQPPGERRVGLVVAALGIVGAVLSLSGFAAFGLGVLIPALAVGIGAALVWRGYDGPADRSRRTLATWLRVAAGAALVVAGLALGVVGQVDFAALRSSVLAVLATLVGVLLLTVPLWVRLWRSLEEERSARVREAERSEIASHLHDSVLQSLALIQKRAGDPAEVAVLARRQERELRAWLFGSGAGESTGGAPSVGGAVEDICADVEEAYGLRVEQVVVGGDVPVGEAADAALGAVREALVNVAKHAGVDTADVYVEVDDGMLVAFVRDRGCGFDPGTVGDDRHGLAGSVRRRVESRSGTVTVRSTLGRGTEIGVEIALGEEMR